MKLGITGRFTVYGDGEDTLHLHSGPGIEIKTTAEEYRKFVADFEAAKNLYEKDQVIKNYFSDRIGDGSKC